MAYFEVNKKPRLSFPTLTGSIVTFNAQYAGLPLKSHTVALTATQSGSGTPSPDNVRTINGYSNINIMATGKNFAPINAHSQTASGTTITVDDDGVATVSNTGTGSHFFEYYRGNFNFPKGTYRLTAWVNGEEYTQSSSVTSPYRIYFSMTNGGQVNAGNSFTVNQDTGLWIIYIQTRNGFTYDNDEVKIQIELGTVKTDWQKFGKLVTISIGSTVYGGEYDARTGVLTVTHELLTLTNVDSVGTQGGLYFFRKSLTATQYSVNMTADNLGDYISETYYPALNHSAAGTFFVTSLGSSLHLTPTDQTLDTVAKMNTYLADNPAVCLIPLAESLRQTIQLPPCPIDTLEGVNNIWADTGDTTLQYPKFG